MDPRYAGREELVREEGRNVWNAWIETEMEIEVEITQRLPSSYTSSPRYKQRSELALQRMAVSLGLQLTSFTLPLCPGRLYTSSPLATSHTCTIWSLLPPLTRLPSADHEQRNRFLSWLC
jgi:hypothetical protein